MVQYKMFEQREINEKILADVEEQVKIARDALDNLKEMTYDETGIQMNSSVQEWYRTAFDALNRFGQYAVADVKGAISMEKKSDNK